MGMPSVNVSFTEKARTVIQRGERGIIAMILKDTAPDKNPIEILTVSDIPLGLSSANKEQVQLALVGYQNAPKKVIAYVLEADAEEYTEAFKWLEVNRFDYLVVPTVSTDNKAQEVATWIKSQRKERKLCKAVLPNLVTDSEGIINFTTSSVFVNDKEYTTEQYCSRIAGIIAGTPLTISCTYAPLPELTNCSKLTKQEMDSAIDAGKFLVYHDGEKVKVGRGINSLTTLTTDKGSQFSKIKIVEAMDMIHDDIVKTAEDSYLGKFANSYDNKCLLISAIDGYFKDLIREGILSSATVGVDIAANKQYLDTKGIDTSSMSDDDMKQAETGDKLFLSAAIKILDAIEEISMPITI